MCFCLCKVYFVKMYYVVQMCCPSRPVFYYVFCVDIGVGVTEGKTVHTVISQWKTQRVNSFSAVFITYSCSRPAAARKRNSGSARTRRTAAESLK
jgi:hypothetical protein